MMRIFKEIAMAPPARARRPRLETIREFLETNVVTSQSDILAVLRARGELVTQSSVSRDLHHMGVRKVDGRYVAPRAASREGEEALHEASTTLLVVEPAGPHVLVVKTPAGHASALAVALDGVAWGEVVGTVAGGDTVFVATRSRRDQARVEKRLRELRARPVAVARSHTLRPQGRT
jgi:transcriptional regulator of arginine metabolism